MKDRSSPTDTVSPRRLSRFEVQPHPGPPNAWGRWFQWRGELLSGSAADGPDSCGCDGGDIEQTERLYRAAYLETARVAALGCDDFELLADVYTDTRRAIKDGNRVWVKFCGEEMLLRRRHHGLVLAPPRARAQAASHMAEAANAYAKAGVGNKEFRARILPAWIGQLEKWCVLSRLKSVSPPRIPAPSERAEEPAKESARNSGAGF